MSKRLIKLLALLAAFALVVAACGDDDDDGGEETPATVLDLAIEAGQFSTLAAAIDAAGLTETLQGEGPFTVLAPTDAAFDAAFEALGITAEDLLASDLLADILLYHVLPIEADSQLVATLDGQSVETALAGETVDVTVDGGTIMVDKAEVVSPDLQAENGIVHVINGVLLPDEAVAAFGVATDDEMTEESTTTTTTTTTTAAPADSTTTTEAVDGDAGEGPGTIVDVAVENGFDTLVAAVQAAGLVDVLSDPDAELTVFAPTNEAFDAALTELGLTAEELLADTELLTAILTYHVLEGIVDSSAAIAADGTDVATLQGATIGVSVVDGGVVLTDQVDRTANVTTADVAASNGIVHVIDNVILPAAPA